MEVYELDSQRVACGHAAWANVYVLIALSVQIHEVPELSWRNACTSRENFSDYQSFTIRRGRIEARRVESIYFFGILSIKCHIFSERNPCAATGPGNASWIAFQRPYSLCNHRSWQCELNSVSEPLKERERKRERGAPKQDFFQIIISSTGYLVPNLYSVICYSFQLLSKRNIIMSHRYHIHLSDNVNQY